MRLIIDTDAGVDDAQALMMALCDPRAEVVAITTLTGNVHLDHVTRNVLTVLDLMGAEVPVYRGAEQPLLPGFWEPEERVHGADGLGGYTPRASSDGRLEPEQAALALVRLADEMPGELTLVALGPLTNVALACCLDPTFPRKIRVFTFMGGTIPPRQHEERQRGVQPLLRPGGGPYRAERLPGSYHAFVETTVKHPFTWEQYEALAALPGERARFFRETTRLSVDLIRNQYRFPGFLLPDPLAMAITLDPALAVEVEQRYVAVELAGTSARPDGDRSSGLAGPPAERAHRHDGGHRRRLRPVRADARLTSGGPARCHATRSIGRPRPCARPSKGCPPCTTSTLWAPLPPAGRTGTLRRQLCPAAWGRDRRTGWGVRPAWSRWLALPGTGISRSRSARTGPPRT